MSNSNLADYESRIDAGVEWLDETCGPDWPDLIEIDHLDLKSPCSCVLGQLGPHILTNKANAPTMWDGPPHYHYWIVEDVIGPLFTSLREANHWPSIAAKEAHVCGFVLDDIEGTGPNWMVLTHAWRDRVAKLQADRGLMVPNED